MSNWNIKSDCSFKAANKLIKESLFNASAHSSYYSCVQYMLHILSCHLGLNDHEINNLNNTTNMTTHKYLKKTIYDSLYKMSPDYAVDFNDDIGALCDRRNVADYRSEIIGDTEAEKLRQLAYTILSQLKITYNL